MTKDHLVATTLAEAFAADPFFTFILPDARRRRRNLLRIFEGSRRHCARVGGVAVRRGGKAAALWSTKETMEIGFLDAVPAGMLMLPMQIGVGNAWRLGAADHHALSFLKEQVPEPFAYLMAVGVDPALRGQVKETHHRRGRKSRRRRKPPHPDAEDREPQQRTPLRAPRASYCGDTP